MSCEGPHSTIAEFARGTAIGPQVYNDCNGCMRGPQELKPQHLAAMSDPDMALLAQIGTEDVRAQPVSVQEPIGAAAASVMSVPYCSSKTRRKRDRC